jgi:hypothetical protein
MHNRMATDVKYATLNLSNTKWEDKEVMHDTCRRGNIQAVCDATDMAVEGNVSKGKRQCGITEYSNSIYPTNAHSLLCKTLHRFANMFRSRGIIIRAPHTLNIVMLLYILYI